MEFSKQKHNPTEQNPWEALVESTFERPVPKAPVVREKKRTPMPKKWLWVVLAAVVVIIAAACILPSFFEADESVAIPEELIPCKEALDQWQVLGSYKITGTFYRYGSSSGTTQWNEQYWVSGEDWVMFNTAYKQVPITSSYLPPAGYMYRDGKRYIAYSDTNPRWAPEPETEREDNSLGLWPMTFQWDTCELVYLGTTQEDYATMIRFTAIDRTKVEAAVYNVEFQMTLGGKLNRVTVIQSRANGIVAKDVYILSSTDADEMAEYIAKQQLLELTDAVLPEISE